MVDVSRKRPSPGSSGEQDTLSVPEYIFPDSRVVLCGTPAESQTVMVKTDVFPPLSSLFWLFLHEAVKVLTPIPVSIKGTEFERAAFFLKSPETAPRKKVPWEVLS